MKGAEGSERPPQYLPTFLSAHKHPHVNHFSHLVAPTPPTSPGDSLLPIRPVRESHRVDDMDVQRPNQGQAHRDFPAQTAQSTVNARDDSFLFNSWVGEGVSMGVGVGSMGGQPGAARMISRERRGGTGHESSPSARRTDRSLERKQRVLDTEHQINSGAWLSGRRRVEAPARALPGSLVGPVAKEGRTKFREECDEMKQGRRRTRAYK